MKIRSVLLAIVLVIGFAAMFLVITAALAVGQDNPRPPSPAIATAKIPFDFWVDDTRLPEGEYALYSVFRLNTLVFLRNTKVDAQEQGVFLMPTGDPVASGDYKLVFVVHEGQHYLREIWASNGKAVLTSQFGIDVAPADTLSEIRLVAEKVAKAAAAN
jgi:hypothetical protein